MKINLFCFFTRTWPNSMRYKIPGRCRHLWRTRPRAVRLVGEGMLCTSSVGRLIHQLVSNYSYTHRESHVHSSLNEIEIKPC